MSSKKQIAEFSTDELFRLAAFDAEVDEEAVSHVRETLMKRMEAMDKGEKVSMEAFEQMHNDLKKQGR